MEAGPIALAALLLAALALAAAAFIGWRRPASTSAPSADIDVAVLRDAISELRAVQARSIEDLRTDVRRSLGETEQQVLTQSGTTQRALTELSAQLASMGEQSRQVGDLAKDIGSLHDLLRAPKLRGGFGELLMQRVLEDALPADAFELQYTYRSGARVDAVLRLADRLVPIDAKFPIESFNALAAATEDADRRAKRRAFVATVKRHIDSVSRYISPEDGTIDVVLMYVPAEQIYYEAFVVSGEDDLREHCALRHVIPTSPNTLLAYLQLVSFAMRGLAVQERTRELQGSIRRAALELEKFRDLHETLGKHLDYASKKYSESLRGLDRATDAMESLTRLPSAEQATLPLSPSIAPERSLGSGELDDVGRLFEDPAPERRGGPRPGSR